MDTHFWFATKAYGWGWVPATWEGWTVTAIYAVAAVLWGVYVFKVMGGSGLRRTKELFAGGILVLSALFVLVAWMTGEPPRRRWGST